MRLPYRRQMFPLKPSFGLSGEMGIAGPSLQRRACAVLHPSEQMSRPTRSTNLYKAIFQQLEPMIAHLLEKLTLDWVLNIRVSQHNLRQQPVTLPISKQAPTRIRSEKAIFDRYPPSRSSSSPLRRRAASRGCAHKPQEAS